jgi:hypothetical protein
MLRFPMHLKILNYNLRFLQDMFAMEARILKRNSCDGVLIGYPEILAGTTLASRSVKFAKMRYVVHVTRHFNCSKWHPNN